MLARIISAIGGTITALLGLRFVFMLFGANRGHAFVDFVYNITYPLVAPFFGIFNYDPQFGVSRFEFETLIAMLFYAVITAVLVRLTATSSRRGDV